MATNCNRKIPTVYVKSNYNIEGDLKITGKLFVNGKDISKAGGSINGLSGDVKIVAGKGIDISLDKQSGQIIISNSLVGTGIWKFVQIKGLENQSITDLVENPEIETIYLLDKKTFVEAYIYDVTNKTFKKMSTAESGGNLDQIFNKIESFESQIETFEDKISNFEEQVTKLEEIEEKIETLDSSSSKIERYESLDNISNPSSNTIYIISSEDGPISYIWNETSKEYENLGGGNNNPTIDLSNYVTKPEIENFVEKTYIEDNYASKEDIQNFVNKEELNNYVTQNDISKLATKEEISNLVSKNDLENYVTNESLSQNYASKEDIQNFVTSDDVSNLISSSQIDVKAYVPSDGESPNYISVEKDENTNTYTIKSTETLSNVISEAKNLSSDNAELISQLTERVTSLENNQGEGGGGSTDNIDSEEVKNIVNETLIEKGIISESGDLNFTTESEVKNIVEDVLSAHITTAYSSLDELVNDISNLEDNKVYWVNDKGTVEQYIKKEDSVYQISGGFNVKKDSTDSIKWEMPWDTSVTEIECNLPELVDGSYLFKDYINLESFYGDTINMTKAVEMFKGTKLKSFAGELSSLDDGTEMFSGCSLDYDSIVNIIDTLADYTDGNNHIITIGHDSSINESDLNELKVEGESKGWTILFEKSINN